LADFFDIAQRRLPFHTRLNQKGNQRAYTVEEHTEPRNELVFVKDGPCVLVVLQDDVEDLEVDIDLEERLLWEELVETAQTIDLGNVVAG
jgi:hypothetical protein